MKIRIWLIHIVSMLLVIGLSIFAQLNANNKADSMIYLYGVAFVALITLAFDLTLLIRFQRISEQDHREYSLRIRKQERFLKLLADEMMAPVKAITYMLSNLRESLDNPESERLYLNKLEASNRSLVDLIDNLQDLNALECGKIELDESELSLSDLLEKLLHRCYTTIVRREQILSVHTSRLKYDHVIGDEKRLLQVCTKLLENASEYSDTMADIDITLEESESEKGPGYISFTFSVRDTGVGISEEFLAKLLDANFSLDDELDSVRGTGLGIAVSKSILETMGGRLFGESKKGEGSTFGFSLDMKLAEPSQEELLLEDRKVLVIEPSSNQQKELTEALEEIGISTVIVSASGIEAIEIVMCEMEMGEAVQQVIFSSGISDISSDKLIAQLRELDSDISLYITVDDPDVYDDRMKEEGVSGAIQKPIIQSALYKTLQGSADL